MMIAIDFDGTCVSSNYPYLGKDIGAAPVLKKLVDNGHKLILYTMRDTGHFIDVAIKWFKDNNIPLFAINDNPEISMSRKVYAHLYIDDTALGIPLIKDPNEKWPYVDWKEVEILLKRKGIINEIN